MDNYPAFILTATGSAQSRYRGLSLWMESLPEPLTPRPQLEERIEADVAIVGAGYTGLWAAYYLLRDDPSLRVVVLEKEIAGFGASGRNGGWCSALFAAPAVKIARLYGRDAAVAMQHAMFDTVDEVGRVIAREHIEADFHKGGTLTLVTAPHQLERVRSMIRTDRRWGFGEEHSRWLDAGELHERLAVQGGLGARFTPHCARVHPARLVRGLARRVESLGGIIYEQTTATQLRPGQVVAEAGLVDAPIVLRATEGYTSGLRGMSRTILPLYSLMIATEPLPQEVWDEVGWQNRETVHDGRHLLIYAQRTSDDRIAIGGRGAPYHFGSRIDPRNDRDPKVFASLRQVLRELFPATRRARITHEWGGCLGVPRDWFSSVGFDPRSGLGWAGGYVGDGVSTSNLAGRTLRDLIRGDTTELTELPWVNHRSRRWEPEPLRWLGVNLGLKAMGHADRVEERTGRPTRRGEAVKRMIGL